MSKKEQNKGSRGVGDNWLAPFFGGSRKFSQQYFKAELGISIKSVQRLYSGEIELERNSENATKLAHTVQKDGLLTQRELPLDQLIESLCLAQKNHILERAHKEARSQKIDTSLLVESLQDCLNVGLEKLVERWCSRAEGASGVQLLATVLAGHIQFNEFKKIQRIIDDPLDIWVEQELLGEDRNRILKQIMYVERCIGAIAVSCAVPIDLDKIKFLDGIQLGHLKKAWAIRLIIDNALGYSLTQVHPAHHEPKVPEQYAANLECVESTNPEHQARQVIEQDAHSSFFDVTDYTVRTKLTQLDVRSDLPKVTEMPEPGDEDYEQKMADYCETYNYAVCSAYNVSREHRFLYTHGEFPKEVRKRLHDLGVKDLRIVELLQQHDRIPSLRIDGRELSGWLTKCLKKIKNATDRVIERESELPKGNSVIIYAAQIGVVGDGNTIYDRKSS